MSVADIYIKLHYIPALTKCKNIINITVIIINYSMSHGLLHPAANLKIFNFLYFLKAEDFFFKCKLFFCYTFFFVCAFSFPISLFLIYLQNKIHETSALYTKTTAKPSLCKKQSFEATPCWGMFQWRKISGAGGWLTCTARSPKGRTFPCPPVRSQPTCSRRCGSSVRLHPDAPHGIFPGDTRLFWHLWLTNGINRVRLQDRLVNTAAISPVLYILVVAPFDTTLRASTVCALSPLTRYEARFAEKVKRQKCFHFWNRHIPEDLRKRSWMYFPKRLLLSFMTVWEFPKASSRGFTWSVKHRLRTDWLIECFQGNFHHGTASHLQVQTVRKLC